MHSLARALLASATFAVVRGQGVIISAKGTLGTSVSMAVDINNPADANFISQEEVVRNVVNACGRTLLKGGISQSGETEKIIAAGTFTRVDKGGNLTVTISQRTSQGSGPFTCDLDEASNVLGVSGQTPLTVQQDSSEFGTGNLTLTVTMPSNLTCIGGSTGNFCTVRCVNEQNFGGCVAVQQTDVTPNVNVPDEIVSAEFEDDIDAQIEQNKKDLAAAQAGLASAATVDEQGIEIAKAILGSAVNVGGAAATTTSTTATPTSRRGRNRNRLGNGRSGRNRNNRVN